MPRIDQSRYAIRQTVDGEIHDQKKLLTRLLRHELHHLYMMQWGIKIGPNYGQYRVLPTLVEFWSMKT